MCGKTGNHFLYHQCVSNLYKGVLKTQTLFSSKQKSQKQSATCPGRWDHRPSHTWPDSPAACWGACRSTASPQSSSRWACAWARALRAWPLAAAHLSAAALLSWLSARSSGWLDRSRWAALSDAVFASAVAASSSSGPCSESRRICAGFVRRTKSTLKSVKATAWSKSFDGDC